MPEDTPSETPTDKTVADPSLRQSDSAATADGTAAVESGLTERLRQLVYGLFGFDLSANLLPRLLDWLAGYGLVLLRLQEIDWLESVVVFVSVVGYGNLMWGLSWLFLFALALYYVPRLIRPADTEWPHSPVARLLLVVPFAAAGLLAEAGFRQLFATIGVRSTAPFTAPLTPLTIGGTALVSGVLFAGVYVSASSGSSRGNSLPGYVVRGLVLVVIVGVFLAEFSLLSPIAEVFAIGFLLISRNSPLPSDPAERLIEGATTVWEHAALVVMAVWVTSVLAIVGLVALVIRFRSPADFLSVAPLGFLFLLLVATSVGLYAYLYCSRALLISRRNADPQQESLNSLAVGLLPTAIGVGLLVDRYVFADPLAGPTLFQFLVGGLLVYFSLVSLLFSELDGGDDHDELSVRKSVTKSDDGGRKLVRFSLDSEYDESVEVSINDPLTKWQHHEIWMYDTNQVEDWARTDAGVEFTTVVPADGEKEIKYGVAIPQRIGARNYQTEYDTVVRPAERSEFDDGESAHTSTENIASFNYPRHHQAVFDVGVFFGLTTLWVRQFAPMAPVFETTVPIVGSGSTTGAAVPLLTVIASYLPFAVAIQIRELASGSSLDTESGTGVRETVVANRGTVLAAGAVLSATVFAFCYRIPAQFGISTAHAVLVGSLCFLLLARLSIGVSRTLTLVAQVCRSGMLLVGRQLVVLFVTLLIVPAIVFDW
ncbi:hypothetical protein [Haloarcula montana]|uniref:hypothetical protein n=1 Tax=Haloarcula montana TaxID=3111776 RepID=UPI002D78B941|nr:hypothetical protein [Haloarcula sp. GH36]